MKKSLIAAGFALAAGLSAASAGETVPLAGYCVRGADAVALQGSRADTRVDRLTGETGVTEVTITNQDISKLFKNLIHVSQSKPEFDDEGFTEGNVSEIGVLIRRTAYDTTLRGSNLTIRNIFKGYLEDWSCKLSPVPLPGQPLQLHPGLSPQ